MHFRREQRLQSDESRSFPDGSVDLREHAMCGADDVRYSGARNHAENNVTSKMLKIRASIPPMLCSAVFAGVLACNPGESDNRESTYGARPVPAPAGRSEDSVTAVRGTIVRASPTELVVKSDSGDITVAIAQPFHFYVRTPADLSDVKDSSFLGVTTVEQPDGSQRATEIHVFPEELRGLGEGSRILSAAPAGGASRMTNGTAADSRMTNGTAGASRMSNGSVRREGESTLVVHYRGGSQTVTVPPGTHVTELTAATREPAVGDQVVLLAKRRPDGSLATDKAVSTKG